jgi:hypothetical protein
MGPLGCPEMSVTNCQLKLRKIPEEQRSHLHFDGRMNHDIIEKVYIACIPSAGPSGRAIWASVCGRSHVGIAVSN